MLRFPYLLISSFPTVNISKTKTKGLSETKHCDYVFLSDDDFFPIKTNYVGPYLRAHQNSMNHHFMYLIDKIGNKVIHGEKKEVRPGIESYKNCGGMLLFVTRACIDKVGGFDDRMKFYGHEHGQWSAKIHKEGFTPDGKYLCPNEALDYFFTIDFHKGWMGITPEYWNQDTVMQSSITTTSEKKNSYLESIEYNAKFINDLNYYTPI